MVPERGGQSKDIEQAVWEVAFLEPDQVPPEGSGKIVGGGSGLDHQNATAGPREEDLQRRSIGKAQEVVLNIYLNTLRYATVFKP